MHGMETDIEPLTRRYERIMTGLFTAITAHTRIFPLWLNPLYSRLILKGHCRALNLLGKLAAGLYRQPRPRTAPPPTPALPTPRSAGGEGEVKGGHHWGKFFGSFFQKRTACFTSTRSGAHKHIWPSAAAASVWM